MECIQDVCEKDQDQDLSQHQNNKNHDCLLTQADAVDGEGDIQNVCEKDEDQDLSQHQNNKNHDCLLTQADAVDEEGDIQDVCEKDEDYDLGSLHFAAQRCDTEDVRRILMWSTNVDVLDKKQNTPLHIATLNGHVDVVNLLLRENANVNSRNASGKTSLHLASENGHLALAQIFLDNRADVDVLGTNDYTPLHIATLNGHANVVDLLLNKNANVNSRNAFGQTSLHLASKNGHFTIAQILLNSNADVHITDQSNNTPIDIAIRRGHSELVQLLMTSIEYPHKWVTSLHFAAKCGNTKDVRQLLLNHDENADATNLYGDTPLHLASENGHFEVVEVLLRNNADANIRNASSKTPLHIAAEMGYAEIVKAAIDHNGEVNAVDGNGETALHLASENGHFEVAEFLLRNNADANIRNAFYRTPLHIAAAMGYAEIVKTMIDHQGDANAVDGNGDTALHYAASNGHSVVVNVLLNQTTEIYPQIRSKLAVSQVPSAELELPKHPIGNKVDVDQPSNQITADVEIVDIQLSHSSALSGECRGQATTSDLADEHRHAEIAENLIFQGATVDACNNDEMIPLPLACRDGHLSVVDILLDSNATVNVTKQPEETSFYLTARNGKNLMFNDANVNACNNDKMTALHLACKNGHTSIVEILLDNHAIVDVTEQSKETPLYLAAKNGHADVSDLLIRRGVCDFVETTYEHLYERNNIIQTPLLVAIKKGHTEVVEVILKHCSRISEKLTTVTDGRKFQENTKTGVIPVELLKSDGRRVSAELIWTERNIPLEKRRDKDGFAPLVLIALSKDPKMVELFLRVDECMYSETDIVDSFRSIIKDVIEYGMNFTKLGQFLINSSKFNVNHQDKHLNTFLHNVVQLNRKKAEWLHLQTQLFNDVIQLLLEKGADFNMKNSHGRTPLIYASARGYCNAIRLLFDWEHKSGMKLDIDARDRGGETALIAGAERLDVSIVRLLLNHKVSVNLYDYNGFTALHSALYKSNRYIYSEEEYSQIVHRISAPGTWKDKPVFRNALIYQLECSFLPDMVKLLLANGEINVNAIDFRGNTPLDLAVKSRRRITSETFEALVNRGAIQNFLEPKDEAPTEVTTVDERGRNPLHRLIIFRIKSYDANYRKLVDAIIQRPENFRRLAAETDDKGRTPLHYVVMSPSLARFESHDLLRALLEIGSNANAADVYGKTPLHYAEKNILEENQQYELLVHYGADENTKDKHGHTPRDLKELRESVTNSKRNARNLPIGKKKLYLSTDVAQVLNINYVTELSKRKLFETIRICSQSPRPQDSSEEAVWKIWTENEFIRINRRISQLNPLVHQFIGRLADGIKKKDWRFECQPILVGSANEETKVVISADFDFNFRLTKFSQFCEAFPHPLGLKGYFQLRQKPIKDTKSWNDGGFACFFNLDNFLLTNEVNSRFRNILEEILSDHNFWQDEHFSEWQLTDTLQSNYDRVGLCRTLFLRMNHPIEDGEGGFLFVNIISIDIVACVLVEDFWPDDSLPVVINPSIKTDGCTFVFDKPSSDRNKAHEFDFPFSETFARISFAPVESRIIKESSPLIKAAYIVCKMILHSFRKTTYKLKTCLLFCMEALTDRNGNETRTEEEIPSKQLLFWVERIMFCFTEFSRHEIFPCYFMHSFKQKVEEMDDFHSRIVTKIEGKETKVSLSYSAVYDAYLDLCPDDTAIDMPIVRNQFTEEILIANHDPKWEQFDREEFIRKLSSRSSS